MVSFPPEGPFHPHQSSKTKRRLKNRIKVWVPLVVGATLIGGALGWGILSQPGSLAWLHGSQANATPARPDTILIATVTPDETPPKGPSATHKTVLPVTSPDGEVAIQDVNHIRVGISDRSFNYQEYPLVKVSATGGFKVTDKSTGKTVYDAPAWKGITFQRNKNGFYFVVDGINGKKGPYKGPMGVIPDEGGSTLRVVNITRKGKIPTYRGEFEITKAYSSPNKLSLVNILLLQNYLKAVVPNELPYSFGYEAIKAQAVAARNYAIRPREKSWPQFDICDSQYCQVYFGKHTEHHLTSKALTETHGLVATYEGEPVLALYSSAHGGYQEAYHNSFSDPKTYKFPDDPIPYLRGGADYSQTEKQYPDLSTEEAARDFWTNTSIPSYDVKSSYNRWTKTWNRLSLESSLNQQLRKVCSEKYTAVFVNPCLKGNQSIGTFQRVNVLRRGKSGKAMELEIIGSNGKWTVKKEFVIRKVFAHGGRMLPSANVVFSHMTGANNVVVTLKAQGGGFGHGVGMSQYGASYMSGHNHPFNEIIQHYYRGAAISSIPLVFGSAKRPTDPSSANPKVAQQTTFFSKRGKGYLRVQTQPGPEPIKLLINGKGYSLVLDKDSAGVADVSQFLVANATNTLLVYPDTSNPNRPIRAWIEVFPDANAPWLKPLQSKAYGASIPLYPHSTATSAVEGNSGAS